MFLLVALVMAVPAQQAAADEVPSDEPMPAPKTAREAPLPSFDDKVGDAFESARDGFASAGAIGVDLIVLRPMGMAATIAGSGAFLCSMPLVLPGGLSEDVSQDVADTWEIFVRLPFAYTFQRRLGRF